MVVCDIIQTRMVSSAFLFLLLLYSCGSVAMMQDIDLSTFDSTTGFKMQGVAANNYAGFSVSVAGDVNKDGIKDMIIGAYFASPEVSLTTRANAGITYIVFGRPASNGAVSRNNIDFSTFTTGNSLGFSIIGNMNDFCGYAVSAGGDLNNDGIDDVIVGAYYARANAGVTYVIFGRSFLNGPSSFTNIDLSTFSTGNVLGFTIVGANGGDLSGISVSGGGDVNMDGINDIIIGAFRADPITISSITRNNAGVTYVVFGRSASDGVSSYVNIDLSTFTTGSVLGFSIIGAVDEDSSGFSVSIGGDINNDGIKDIIVGATQASPLPDRTSAGSVYVVFGRSIGSTTPYSNIDLADFTLGSVLGFRIAGAVAGDNCGTSVTGVDVNGDGVSDVIIGAIGASPIRNAVSIGNAGVTYVVFGRKASDGVSSYVNIDLYTFTTGSVLGFSIIGAVTGDQSGVSVSSAGDVNGDGVKDVILGAYQADPNVGGVIRYSAGITYVVFGRSISTRAMSYTNIDLATFTVGNVLGFRILGGTGGDGSGYSVSATGDVNGDGCSDILVGAYAANGGAGVTYAILPTTQPTSQPSSHPSTQPSSQPSRRPTGQPTAKPSMQPSAQPISRPSAQPTIQPTSHPTGQPSAQPSTQPVSRPTSQPSSQPSVQPSQQPSIQPSRQPTAQPSSQPSMQPSIQPSGRPSAQPSRQPSARPTDQPTAQPSRQPTGQPTTQPSSLPSAQPSSCPTQQPTSQPSALPTGQPSNVPSTQPSAQPSFLPSSQPSAQPSDQPSASPSTQPSAPPSGQPSHVPSSLPSAQPSSRPTSLPSTQPSLQPSEQPSSWPSVQPSAQPSSRPTSLPSTQPSVQPSEQPSSWPSVQPSAQPSSRPTSLPTTQPSAQPSLQPTLQPSSYPSGQPSAQPSSRPSMQPTAQPTFQPSQQPSTWPSMQPSDHPSTQPSRQPASLPSAQPTPGPSAQPSGQPVGRPTSQPSVQPSVQPFSQPSQQPRATPTAQPSSQPSARPTLVRRTVYVAPAVLLTGVDYANSNLWVYNSIGTNRSTSCVLVNPSTGAPVTQYTFDWDNVMSVLTAGVENTVVISGRTVTAAVATSHIATCTLDQLLMQCAVTSLSGVYFLAAAYVPYPNKIVYVGWYNVHTSVSIRDIPTGSVQSYIYTATNMKALTLSKVQSPPYFIGSCVAGTAIRATAAPVNYIVAGMFRTDNAVLSAMVLSPVNGDILNNADLVNAMALEYAGPDSFIAGGLQLADVSGLHAYLVRANALYMSVQYCVRYRSLSSGRRALSAAAVSSSVVRGMVLVDTALFMILDYTYNNHTSLTVLKTSAGTGEITKQVHVTAPNASLHCTDIASAGVLLSIVCSTYNNVSQTLSVLLSLTQDLSVLVLPASLVFSEIDVFQMENIPFQRKTLTVTKTVTSIATSTYQFNTASQGPTRRPSLIPSYAPSTPPSSAPSAQPSSSPTAGPTVSARPTSQPSSAVPTNTHKPSAVPIVSPTRTPSVAPSARPSVCPTAQPSARPTQQLSARPTANPTVSPSTNPTRLPSVKPTATSSRRPSSLLTPAPTSHPSSADGVGSGGAGKDVPSYVVGVSVGAGLFVLLALYVLYRAHDHAEQQKHREGRKAEFFRKQAQLAEQARAETAQYVQEERDRELAHKLEKQRHREQKIQNKRRVTNSSKDKNRGCAIGAFATGSIQVAVNEQSLPGAMHAQSIGSASGGIGTSVRDGSTSSVNISSQHSSEMSEYSSVNNNGVLHSSVSCSSVDTMYNEVLNSGVYNTEHVVGSGGSSNSYKSKDIHNNNSSSISSSYSGSSENES